ncbi:SNF1-interacting protein [Vermiconidia calcicola]|uniref:SNF1-interacting protein n=1 Tax=Vermiconidia calcicola TaxID=1690605 RepID=A0ACC3N7D7_9PEZI|nr:SNF1-interacting protein [Vermiconidia calcicola]
MGNSSSKDSKAAQKQGNNRQQSERPAPGQPSQAPQPPIDRVVTQIYSGRPERGNRPDLPFLNLVRDRNQSEEAPERPRETKQEREARRLEKERQARVKERERSIREENVDGGYLVTLGTYTGPEDFNKGIVRQLQIERRLAPFWKGLNDHSDSWTEAQLVAAARGLPIPAADEVPPEMERTVSQASSNPGRSDFNVNNLTVPINSRSQSYESGTSARISASHPAFSTSGPASPNDPTSSTAQLFRGRAKTLASLATGSKSHSPDLTPREVKLPKDPYVNGQPLEALLYKDASECPICFLYYPPYLNKTRCCDQPICSECFVQIKRPDPHPPEHEQPDQQRPPEEEAETLVSEVAACPFCVTPEFGVSYESPPFRRGLAYAHSSNPLRNPTSAMSSTSSLGAGGAGRRRAASLSANAPSVITTDRVRPDWARKLADARAHALRRSAAATALHNAAYVLGNQGDGQQRVNLSSFGRRRRTLFGDSPGASGSGTPRGPEGLLMSPYGHLIRANLANREAGEEGNDDLFPARGSSRRTRVDDLEDLMMMEAIRLSLVAEEERSKKEEKEARKDAKKRAKEEKKEAKQQEKLAKKGGSSNMYNAGPNESSSTWASASMARSTSNLGMQFSIPEEQVQGKGKAPAQDFAGFNPLSEPTSTLNTEMQETKDDEPGLSMPASSSAPKLTTEDSQRYLEESRANLQPTATTPIFTPSRPSSHTRQLSNASSLASSMDSPPGSFRADSNISSGNPSGLDTTSSAQESGTGTPAAGTPSLEPMLNFGSLAAMIGNEDKAGQQDEHLEHASTDPAEERLKEPSPTGSPRISSAVSEGNRSRGDSGESSGSSTAPPPIYVEAALGEDEITPAPRGGQHRHDVDSKDIGSFHVLDRGHGREHGREATQ